MYFKMSSAKWQPFCLSLNVLTSTCQNKSTSLANVYCWDRYLFHIFGPDERDLIFCFDFFHILFVVKLIQFSMQTLIENACVGQFKAIGVIFSD